MSNLDDCLEELAEVGLSCAIWESNARMRAGGKATARWGAGTLLWALLQTAYCRGTLSPLTRRKSICR